jgi:hypothetical protein
MDIIFETREYTWTYGHAPRGRGNWWFSFEGMEFSHWGTYSEAKAAVRKHIREIAPHGYKNLVVVKVLT